ncbi:hypothetical protein [Alkalimarinus alittae]|uniref:Uncharacterized protein n=1 Tax=Alkalimarinus alittae TaxID=2961619 RepID=A0ABY6N0F9_9ALTE|nr:hypothetical protein [Alkalimarinus alittae]UZE95585.1 hypothetical protein NKI27_16175 [Alkalimarinus alittae]
MTLWYSRYVIPAAAASSEFSFGANVGKPASLDDRGREDNIRSSVDDGRLGEHVSVPKSAADILSALSVTPSAKNDVQSSDSLVASTPPQSTSVNPSEAINIASDNLVKNERVEVPSTSERSKSALVKASSKPKLKTLELMLWVGEKNWFLSDADSEFPDQLKRELLLNIASALGENVESTPVACFKWPFFGNQRLPGNDVESMLGLLHGWLDGQLKSDRLNGFLMGERVTELLLHLTSNEYLGKELELNLSDERGVNVMATYSLNDLLREPLYKRAIWQQLSPFRIK